MMKRITKTFMRDYFNDCQYMSPGHLNINPNREMNTREV